MNEHSLIIMPRTTREPTILDFIGPTRKDLVLALKERGTATADELASATYLSIAAARNHLLVLERTGMVTHDVLRGTVGRPLHLYRLTDHGEALFPQCYTALAEELLQVASADAGQSEHALQAIEESQLSSFVSPGTTEPHRRMGRIVAALDARGFAPRVEHVSPSEWQVNIRHCPLFQLSKKYPELCQLERRILARAAGDDAIVEYPQHRLAGSATCTAVLRWPGYSE